MPFLASREDARSLSASPIPGFAPDSLFVGLGAMGLEVAAYESAHRPSLTQLKELHEKRQNRRATPVVIVVAYADRLAAIATRFGEEWSAFLDVSRSQAERIAEAALGLPDRHTADAFLRSNLPLLEQSIPGVRNAGLFALHELETGVPCRADWNSASSSAQGLLRLRGRELVTALGFNLEQTPWPVSILRVSGNRSAIAVFLEQPTEIEPANTAYDGLSPVSYALAKADAENLDYVLVAAGSVLRIYPVKPGVGTGRRGRTETFVELNLALLDERSAGYLTLLGSAAALAPHGSFAQILDASRRFAADLGERLRDRVYTDVMPRLSQSIANARRLRNPSREKLQETLEMALLTLFRLLFVAYAEDKELLPYHTSETYREHSLKRMAQRLSDESANDVQYSRESFYWTEVAQLWKAIDKGNRAWRVPAYNGGLFNEDRSEASQALARIELKDTEFAPALRALLLDETEEGVLGPVDFRALGVREFGTIYEGLLEQELSMAGQDLIVDDRGSYVPANTARRGGRGRGRGTVPQAEVVVREGDVYLHDKSGARKASGAYYTKDFAVEHLLERALDPALADHFARLDAVYDDREAADGFFDFHVADIAMGSGHFLVAAVDHLERGMSGYLAKRRLPGVRDELERLRSKAREELGDDWRGEPIEDTQLLRRQIARRCVHGVDLNPLAVELARLSLWIHTFVPGLPLSFLDMNLVVGNALVGVATLEEAADLLNADDLFGASAEEMLGRAREPLAKLGKLAEATTAEVKEARKLYQKVLERVAPTNDLFTVLAASRIDQDIAAHVEQGLVASRFEEAGLFRDRLVRKAETSMRGLQPLHFPIAFPQVFLRSRSGFDAVLGNPPWEKLKLEEHAFWARHSPGLRGLGRREMGMQLNALRRNRQDLVELYEEERASTDALRAVIASGPFPGIGTGDPDLYKAFCWRFWNLISNTGGRLGVVLPRSTFAALGSKEFRETLFDAAAEVDLTMLSNNSEWAFGGIDPRYTIALTIATRGPRASRGARIILDGPYRSFAHYEGRPKRVAELPLFYGDEVRHWNDAAALPLLPSAQSAAVFLKLRKSPRLDLNEPGIWRARPYVELHATSDAHLMDLESERRPRGYWPVYKGESFDLWRPDTSVYYGWADPATVLPILQEGRKRSARKIGSPFNEFPSSFLNSRQTLPCQKARIAFRDVTNRTNQRTMIAALVPPHVFLNHKAPYFLFPRGSTEDEAYLLGVLSSLPLDWYARRFVELSMTYFVLNPFPVPRPPAHSAMRQLVVETATKLAVGSDERFEEWGASLRMSPSAIAEEEKQILRCRLDAATSKLYGLDEGDLVHIFETFHENWDYGDQLDLTLSEFKRLPQT